MRLEVLAAYAMGLGLPILEVCRRGAHLAHFANYADDFLAGGLLVWAAVSASRRRRAGAVLLIVAWAMVCCGFYYSIVGQIQNPAPMDVSGLSNLSVVLVKGALAAAALGALVLSCRRVIEPLDAP
jgi:hypothetical protein